jgi:peptidoglycan-associated lipoprotein
MGNDLNELNRSIPLAPIFFAYDSGEMTTEAQSRLANNAEVMRNNLTWIVTIEGHCDERGTTEYNLALSERRALAARDYLVALGIPVHRLRTVSYGEEFPFEAGNDEAAWAQNRRAHFVVTAQ